MSTTTAGPSQTVPIRLGPGIKFHPGGGSDTTPLLLLLLLQLLLLLLLLLLLQFHPQKTVQCSDLQKSQLLK